jgi:sigma-B regulation protein RsbU (phosphoserine phosphatase)
MDDLLNTAPCGFVEFADDSTILLVNATLATLLGYAPGDLAGQSFNVLLTPGSRVFHQTHFFPLLKMQGRVDELYLSLRSRQGEDMPVLANAVRRERAGGVVNDCVVVPMYQRRRYEDELLQAKKAAEGVTAQLAEANRQLAVMLLEVEKAHAELQQTETELVAANARLQELDRLKDELLAVTSHDLRTPITTIRMATDILLDEKRAARVDHKRYLETISQATKRLLILSNDLSDLARINTGELHLELKPVLLSEVARAVVRELTVTAAAKSITVSLDLAGDEPPVAGDYNRLYQVVSNLLGNAIKFTPTGGQVRIRVQPEPGWVGLQVQDTGIGIPAGQVAEMFQHFKHASRPGTAGERGTGLGLTIVRRLVELHGGQIAVESEEGRGTTFTIRLPVAGPAPARNGAG